MTAACRNLARQCVTLLPPDRDPSAAERVDSLVRWALAFSVAARQHLREDPDLSGLAGLVRPERATEVSRAAHRPLYVLERLSAELVGCQRARLLDTVERSALDNNLRAMVEALGGMERIARTRMPFAYIVHLRSFLVLWLLALPFTMVRGPGGAEAGASCALARPPACPPARAPRAGELPALGRDPRVRARRLLAARPRGDRRRGRAPVWA